MKLFANNRQKLTLNKIRKPSTPPKLQIQVVNGCKVSNIHNPLTNKDTNIIKLGNSSIFRKQSENEANKRQRIQYDLIRCQSISCVNPCGRSNIKLIPTLHKLNTSNIDEKTTNKKMIEQIVETSCKNLILNFKKKGTLAIKNNFYYMHVESFNDMVAQLGQRISQQINKTDKQLSSDFPSGNLNSSAQLLEKHESNLSVFNQFSINQSYQQMKNLSYEFSNINLHLHYEHSTRQRKSFWKIIQNYQTEKPNEQSFNFLLDKNKYLKEEISNKQFELQKLNENIEQMNKTVAKKNLQAKTIQQKVKQHEKYLAQVEKIVKDIEGFVNKQPNKILQQQAEGYKQRQQELFDLAFLLEQSAPSSISAFVQQLIMIPFQSFKLTLKSFSHAQNDSINYVITQKEMEGFKVSINSAFDSTIEKLKTIIEKKASRIENFVGIMRRLASYTIGKRQYLTEINKKMAVVYMAVDKKLKIIEQSLAILDNGDKLKHLIELRQYITNMRSIYCEAEVFY